MKDADLHRQFESFANGHVQVGEMPEWMHVRGNCAWYVYHRARTAGSETVGRRS